jgi:hypothetical protein
MTAQYVHQLIYYLKMNLKIPKGNQNPYIEEETPVVCQHPSIVPTPVVCQHPSIVPTPVVCRDEVFWSFFLNI